MANPLHNILTRKKRIFQQYNTFRKAIFSELAPKEAETILYVLPWLLSVNHPDIPGYIRDLEKPFRIFNIDNEPEIRKREEALKRRFGAKRSGSLLRPPSDCRPIIGLYTIGSVGSISQTSGSDCDIWVCYDRDDFNEKSWKQLHQKINLLKDWLDQNIRMPVYFFICEVNDIREGRFGTVDTESSGSTQKNVLKEEFYRTCIVISGKIPLWWICQGDDGPVEYDAARDIVRDESYGEYDIIDFGNLDNIEATEYFGAALWQLNKSLTAPLKSILKMILLKMQLEAPKERLICHQFREMVLKGPRGGLFPEPSMFLMEAIFAYFEEYEDARLLAFLKECFYLRCEIRPYERGQGIKKKLASELFKKYPIDIKRRITISNFAAWDFDSQIRFGKTIFKLLFRIYKDISTAHAGKASRIDQQDLTILGRKIAASYQVKEFKAPVLQKPIPKLNLSQLNLVLAGDRWCIYSGGDRTRPILAHADIVHNIAFIVWNDLFDPHAIHMEPNASGVTLQEIINLGSRIREMFGSCDVLNTDYAHFLKPERIAKLLVVVSFEKSPWEKDINDFAVIYKNSWGELFIRRFSSPRKLESFLRSSMPDRTAVETKCYVQRNSTYYEKIIERTKKILTPFT